MACDEFDYHSRRKKMTDDLVKRLREKAFRAESCEMLETAADRIEKLENALKELLSLGEWGLNDLARTVAREALEEKEGA
jgi:hypothetical protein